ncbi:hypothetical protein OPV22_035099 [Ensete ventricosum]|uniref:MIP18 family-like domain-containing protein n=1 Tax=Ensete ventricosum TaxID=4639 RepID=A0AAX5NCT0_ENSVE|nr:hypothetical protein OPV22_035099 [Ensete ventricosum]
MFSNSFRGPTTTRLEIRSCDAAVEPVTSPMIRQHRRRQPTSLPPSPNKRSALKSRCLLTTVQKAYKRSWKFHQDPEHPYTLEELKVVTEDSIEVNDKISHVRVTFTPTVEHCSLATTIGLCLRVKLMRSLPSHYKVDIRVAPGTHATEAAVNKQLNDKERIAAALENPNLMYMINRISLV